MAKGIGHKQRCRSDTTQAWSGRVRGLVQCLGVLRPIKNDVLHSYEAECLKGTS